MTRMPSDQLRRSIESLGPWFHNLNLNGIATAPNHFLGDYPAFRWRKLKPLLPEIRGRTVLDIGCNAGFFSIAMKRLGADRVVAVDHDPRYLAQAELAIRASGAEIELKQLSAYDVEKLKERFDIVLFMGVLYHLRHPLLALDLIHQHVASDHLILQTLQRGSPRADEVAEDYPFEETGVFKRASYPRLHFVERSYAGDPTNWWIPNRACSEAMLRSAGFEIAARPASDIYVCRRGTG